MVASTIAAVAAISSTAAPHATGWLKLEAYHSSATATIGPGY